MTEKSKTYRIEDAASKSAFECSAQQTVLQAMERTHPGLIQVGCRNGGCGLCKIKVLKGQVRTGVMSRAQVSVEEEAAGMALACRTYPLSDLLFEKSVKQ